MPITELAQLKETLLRYDLTPNKALGQNFFIDGERLAEIVRKAGLQGENVLEIGPGPGALTELALPEAKRLFAVEKDRCMAELLGDIQRDAAEAGKLTVCCGDALTAPLPAPLEKEDFCLIGNLPYYITTPLSERYLAFLPRRAALMVQKEAAARFTAGPGDRVYGPLSVLTACFFHVTGRTEIPRSCYWPQPEVDSAVLFFERKDPVFDPARREDARRFLAFSNRCFAMRRKTLWNGLGRPEGLPDALKELGLREDVRAEALPADILRRLCRLLQG